MQAINKGLEKVVQELSLSENDGPISHNFDKVKLSLMLVASIKSFSREQKIRRIINLHKKHIPFSGRIIKSRKKEKQANEGR